MAKKGNSKPHSHQDAWLIQQAKQIAELKKRMAQDTQETYACFCKVLFEQYKWSFEEITALFSRTQELWNELLDTDEMHSMVEWCEKSTDFSVVGGTDEETDKGTEQER